ncbi:MAG: uridine kinase [Firmicutes bacterium]|nr:uridine kinase [Bacillota bacterium]
MTKNNAQHIPEKPKSPDSCRPDFSPLFRQIDALLAAKAQVLVAIDGNSGAGKTALAEHLTQVYDCNVFHMDDFFLPPELKSMDRLNEPGGNVDYHRFKEEVIMGLLRHRPFQYRVYDCRRQAFTHEVAVTPKPLNIIEGVYSLQPTLIDHYDLKVFLSVGAAEQSRRILERNGPALHRRFLNEWIPLENRYFQELAIAGKCDLVFST